MSEVPTPGHHYYLLCCQVIFGREGTEDIGSLTLNSVLRTDEQKIRVADIAKAHQITQYNFKQKMDLPDIEVKDVVIMTIFHLGYFTEEGFNARPQDAVIAEVAKAAN